MKVWNEAIRGGATLAVACGVAASAAADVVVNRLDSGGGFDPQSFLVGASAQRVSLGPVTASRSAVRFEVPSGRWFTLDSVTIPLSQQIVGTAGNFLRVRLAADLGGRPGATIEVLSENQAVPSHPPPISTTPVSPTTYASASRPALRPGEKYRLVAELTAVPAFSGMSGKFWIRVLLNEQGTESRMLRQRTLNALPTDPWVVSTFEINWPVAFRIDGTPIAERACCNPRTGACGAVLPSVCTALGLTVASGSVVCEPAACPPACPGDFNGSGATTVQDIFDYLAAYFDGC